ncbi:MAG: restriction endonuclease subunit S, partial [Flavobacterium sp.]|uniref:restriction endonuclease subunit S n=1 Tax=Flavobacterium sp. TaxID=239 RepID=UPI00261DEDA5
ANESAEDEILTDPRYIRITDFGNDGKLKNNTFKSLPMSKAENFLLSDGDILFARSGATVGKTFLFKDYSGIACFAGYLIKVSCDTEIMKSEFLYEFTNSGGYENWKQSIFQQSTIQNIGADKYNQLKIAVPSIAEQEEIIRFIYIKTNEINDLITKTQQEIELLKEYKTALISEVVTGKVDVREELKNNI